MVGVHENGTAVGADAAAEEATALDLGDRYRIGAELGRGGMGRVFAAYDEKLGRRVAIKILAPAAHSAEAVRRFEQEARAAGSLNHPNIVVIHDVGRAGPISYIVEELLEGMTLRERLAGGPIAVEDAVALARQLANGLAAAHARGVIHRDLKPENLFITPGDRLKILDFGVAKLLLASGDGDAAPPPADETRTGTTIGTVGYMSPEQVRGLRADARSDVFSFGAILYEMLSGRRAFSRSSSVETGYAILRDEPPALPAHVPERLRELVLGCLRKDPEQRPPSAADLLRALSAERAGPEPGTRTSTGVGHGPRSPRRRMPVRTIVPLLAVVAVAGGVAGSLLVPRLATASKPSIAVLPFADLSAERDQEYLADGIAEEILSDLSRVQGLRVIGRTSSFSFKGQKVGLREIGTRLGVEHVLEGSVRRSGDRIRITTQLVSVEDERPIWSETFERALGDVFAIQDEIASAAIANLRVSLAAPIPDPRGKRPSDPEAYAEVLRGYHLVSRFTDEDMQRAIQAFQRAIAIDPNYAAAHAGLSVALMQRASTFALPPSAAGGAPAVPEEVGRAREAAARAIELAPDMPRGYAARADIRTWRDLDWAGATADLERAIELDSTDPAAHQSYLWIIAAQGRLEEAIAAHDRLTKNEPLHACHTLGVFYNATGQYEAARKSLEYALTIAPGHVRALRELGFTYVLTGRPAEALALNERHDSWWIKRLIEALAYHDLGRAEDSRRASQALDYRFAYQLAQIHAWRGEVEEAFTWLDTARQNRDSGLLYVKYDPLLRNLRGDPRYRSFLQSLKLPLD